METRLLFALSAFAMSAGCGQRAEKGPPITCVGECGPAVPIIVGRVPPGDGGAGEGGASGQSDEPVRLRGSVLILDDIPALTASPFTDLAELLVEGRNGDVTGRYDGINAFSLDGVLRSEATWTEATPGPGDALRTLQPIDTTRANTANELSTELTVVRASELDRAFSVITQPVTRDESMAQAVLVVQKEGRGAAGVRVLAPTAESVIYVENGAFSDAVEETDPSGIVVLANVPSSAWPGSGVTVTLSGPVSGRWDLRVVTGGVTFAGVGE